METLRIFYGKIFDFFFRFEASVVKKEVFSQILRLTESKPHIFQTVFKFKFKNSSNHLQNMSLFPFESILGQKSHFLNNLNMFSSCRPNSYICENHMFYKQTCFGIFLVRF